MIESFPNTFQGHLFPFNDTKSNVKPHVLQYVLHCDMIMIAIHKYYSIHFFQRAFLPFFYNRQDLSVILLIVLSEISISYNSRMWDSMFRLSFPWHMESIFSSCPELRYFDIFNQLWFIPLRSLGIATSISPQSVNSMILAK